MIKNLCFFVSNFQRIDDLFHLAIPPSLRRKSGKGRGGLRRRVASRNGRAELARAEDLKKFFEIHTNTYFANKIKEGETMFVSKWCKHDFLKYNDPAQKFVTFRQRFVNSCAKNYEFNPKIANKL